MKLLKILAILCGLLPFAIAPATAQTPQEQQQLGWAVERGRLLFALDRAAWVATDDMMSRISNPQGAGLRGYVVDRDAEDGLVVIFYARDGERLVAVYRARVGARGVEDPQVFTGAQRPELTPRQARIARTLDAVRAGRITSCGRAVSNVAIVPPAGDSDPIEAYVTAPQMRPGYIQFGGHERISFDASGREIARRPFTRTCLEVPAPPEELRRQGAKLGFNHILDPLPTEVHVFLAMAAQQPIVVMTSDPDRMWEVTGEAIRFLQNGRPNGAR
ncbi:MAG TPA: hypothetical protein VGB54_06670 [Allosphingosinicella sp.]|jgi:CBS domain-containing protein